MTKSNFIKNISEETGLSRTKTQEVVGVICNKVEEALIKERAIKISEESKKTRKIKKRDGSRRVYKMKRLDRFDEPVSEKYSAEEFLELLEALAAVDSIRTITPAFVSLNKKMNRSQILINKMKNRSVKRQEKIDTSLQKLDRLIS